MVFSNSDNSDDIFDADGQGRLFDINDSSGDPLNSASASGPISRGSSDYVPGDDHDELLVAAIKAWSGSAKSLLEPNLFSSKWMKPGEDEAAAKNRWERTLAAFMYEVDNNTIDSTTLYRGQAFDFDHPSDRIRSWSKSTKSALYFAEDHPILIKHETGEEVLLGSADQIQPGDKAVMRGYRLEGVTTGLDINKRIAEISREKMIKHLESGAANASYISVEELEARNRSNRLFFSVAEEKTTVVLRAFDALGPEYLGSILGVGSVFQREGFAELAANLSFKEIENLIQELGKKPELSDQFQEIDSYWQRSKDDLFNKIKEAGDIIWYDRDSPAHVIIANEREIVTKPELNDGLRTIDVIVATSPEEYRTQSRNNFPIYTDALKNYQGTPSDKISYNQRPIPGMWEADFARPDPGISAIGSISPSETALNPGASSDIFQPGASESYPSQTAPNQQSLSFPPSQAGGTGAGSLNNPGLADTSPGGSYPGAQSGMSQNPGNPSLVKPTIGASPGADPLSAGKGLGAADAKISDAKARGEAGADQKSSLSKIKDGAMKALKKLAGAKAAAKALVAALAPYWPIILILALVLLIFFSVASTALGLSEEAFDRLVGKKGAWKSLGITDEMAEKGQKKFGQAASLALDCNSLDPEERRPAPMEGANCVEGIFSAWQKSQQDYFSPIPESAGWLIPAYRGAGRYYSLPWQLFGAVNGARSKFGNPNCAENRSGGIGFMKTQESSWSRYAVNAGSVKITSAATGCKNAEEPLKIFKNYKKKPKGNPVSKTADDSADIFDPVDGIYTEGNELAALGARFQKAKEWDYTGSPAGSCTVPKSDGEIFYPPTPSFDFSGGFSGVKGDGRTLKISSKLIKLGDFYKKKWGGQSTSYKGAIPKKVLIKMLTEIWLAFGANERKAKINAEANYKQVYIESSGRPYASQGMCDINGCPGDPTVAGGLFQFIPDTFDTWKVAGFNDRFNAVDNLLAGVNAQVNSDSLSTTGAKDGGGRRTVSILAGQGGWGPSGGSNPYKNKKKVMVSDSAATGITKPTPYRGKPQTDKISKAILSQGYSPCYVAIIHDWYKMIVKYPPEESVSAGLLPGGVKRVTSPKKLVKCPKNIPQDTDNPCYIDARLLSNMAYISKTFQVYITDAYSGPLPGGGAAGCYASGSQCHSEAGDHPLGAAIDGAPSKGSWDPIDRLAKITEPVQGGIPRPPFRWVGYDGDVNHGRGHHIHLSWDHSGAPPYKLPDWVLVFGEGAAPGGKGKTFNKKFAKEFGNIDIPQTGAMRAAVSITSEFEGFYSCPYNDPVGYATIGYGHLIAYTPVTPAIKRKWKCMTKKEAKALLAKDLNKYNGYVSQYIKAPLTPNMRAALISFTMNVGGGALKESTLRKKLNKKNYRGAAKEFKRWNKGGGIVLPGLTRRREAERKLFLKGSGKLIN